MVFGTLAHLRALAGGLDPFDLRPGGYGPAEARALLAALGEPGRDLYARVQLRLDLVYPAIYAASRALLLWWVTAAGRLACGPLRRLPRAALAALPLTAAALDYLENAAIAAMLAAGPGVEPALVARASGLTRAKSVATLATEAAALLLLGAAGLRRLRRPAPPG
jgi:hypothetical protein